MRRAIGLTLLIVVVTATAWGATSSVQEVRIRWETQAAAPLPGPTPRAVPAADVFTLLQRRRVAGSLPRHRNPELSTDQVVILAFDGQGEQVDAQVLPDPRVLRAEGPGPGATISGQVLQHPTTELLLTLPDDPGIRELRVYHPRWTGSTFVLELLGTIHLP